MLFYERKAKVVDVVCLKITEEATNCGIFYILGRIFVKMVFCEIDLYLILEEKELFPSTTIIVRCPICSNFHSILLHFPSLSSDSIFKSVFYLNKRLIICNNCQYKLLNKASLIFL